MYNYSNIRRPRGRELPGQIGFFVGYPENCPLTAVTLTVRLGCAATCSAKRCRSSDTATLAPRILRRDFQQLRLD
eukprot:1379622-Pyramimonas_sp.AAC.2